MTMPRTPSTLATILAAVALCVLAMSTATAATPAERPPTPAPSTLDGASPTVDTMAGIFDALARVLPRSLDEATFKDTDHLVATLSDLSTLASNAVALERHGRDQSDSFVFLSRTLKRDAREVRRRYEYGRFEEARFLFHQIVDDCVACHTRLPAADGMPIAKDFVVRVDTNGLPPEAKVRLALATRQFAVALDAAEALLLDLSQDPVYLDLRGVLTEYLATAIRVKRDYPRVLKTLEHFRIRPNLTRYLASDVGVWIETLEAELPHRSSPATLARTRSLM